MRERTTEVLQMLLDIIISTTGSERFAQVESRRNCQMSQQTHVDRLTHIQPLSETEKQVSSNCSKALVQHLVRGLKLARL